MARTLGDLVLAAPHDASQALDGDIILYTGGVERARIKSDGTLVGLGGGGSSAITARQQSGATDTLVLADAANAVEYSNGSAVTVTVPANATVAFPVGTVIELVQLGAGPVTVAAAGGVTLDAVGGSLTSAGQYATIVLRKRATDEWVVGGETVQSRVKDSLELLLTPLGCVSANFLPAEVAAASSPSSQSLYAMRVPLKKGMQITGLQLLVAVAAAGLAPTGAFFGLADTNGVVLVQSGNLASAGGWATTGFQNFAFGSTYTVPADGCYYAFFLVNGTWGTTQPTLQRLGGTMIDDTRVDARQGGLTTPPANGNSLTLVNTAVLHFWAGCLGS